MSDGADVELRRQRRHFYAALPMEDFPQIVSLAEDVARMSSDEQFDDGLNAFIEATMHTLSRGTEPQVTGRGPRRYGSSVSADSPGPVP
jgi:hypothetical protein